MDTARDAVEAPFVLKRHGTGSKQSNAILIQAAIFRLISGGNRNAMLFDHFLTPHPRGGLDGLAATSGGGRIRFSCRRTGKTYSAYAAAAGAVMGSVVVMVMMGVVLVIKMPA